MKKIFLAVICLLTSVLCLSGTASAQQWIIDGQQTQTLNLNVSDPQALYTDGSREMTAPLSFAPSLTATGGMFRAYIPWSEQTADLFRLDGDDECIKLSSDPNVSFQVGGILINTSGIGGYGVSVGFEDNTLFGPWKLDQVTDNSKAVLNRSYADTRYVMNGQDSVALGLDTAATGDYSIAAGYKNLASGKYSVAFNGGVDPDEPTEGIYTNVASGIGAAVFGWGNVASGNGAVAFGWESKASGNWSLAAGSSDAIGEFSTAFGEVCTASGSDSFAVGYNASATGDKSVALGHSTTASAQGSFANGFASSASGNYSTAWGSYCGASGQNSIALGTRAKALHPGAVVIADSQNADVTSATNDTFTVRAKNGIYLQGDAIHSSGPLVFDSALTATNGALQIYSTDSDDHLGFFKTLSFQDGLQFCTEGSASLLFGSGNDGLLVGMANIVQLEYGKRINFETGELTGNTGTKEWRVTTDPIDAAGIVSRGYADTRYLRSDTPLTNSLLTSVTNAPLLKMSTGAGFLKPYGNKIEFTDDQTKYLFLVEGDSGNDTGMRVRPSGIYRDEEGSIVRAVELDTGTLYGKWYMTDVDEDEDYTLIHRLYADGRYLRSDSDLTAPLSFSSASTATSGLFRAYNEWNGGVENLLIYDAGNELIKLGDLTTGLQIGSLKVEQYKISQPGTGHTISFEEGLLLGSWGVFSNPDTDYGIVSRGYADVRYLRSDVQLDQPLVFAESLTATSGLFRAYFDPNGQYEDFFIVDGNWETVRLSSTGNASLMIGDTTFGNGAIVMNGSGNRIYIEDGNLDGHWSVDDPTAATEIVNRGYADNRYLQRTEGITTNRVIQAGDTLVISNGLITAINP